MKDPADLDSIVKSILGEEQSEEKTVESAATSTLNSDQSANPFDPVDSTYVCNCAIKVYSCMIGNFKSYQLVHYCSLRLKNTV